MKNIILLCLFFTLSAANLFADNEFKIDPENLLFDKINFDDNDVLKSVTLINGSGQYQYSITSIKFDKDDLELFSCDLPINTSIKYKYQPFNITLKKTKYWMKKYEAELKLTVKFGTKTQDVKQKILVIYNLPNGNGNRPLTYISIPKIEAKIMDTIAVPIILSSLVYNKPILPLNGFKCRLLVNASILTPSDPLERGSIYSGIQEININRVNTLAGKPLKSGDTLAVIKMIVMLGDATASSIIIEGFRWTLNNFEQEFFPDLRNGVVDISNIFYDNRIPRLVNKVSSLEFNILGNPLQEDSELEMIYQGDVMLILLDVFGKPASNLLSLPFHNSKESFKLGIKKSDFPSKGVYYARLYNEHDVVTRILIVE